MSVRPSRHRVSALVAVAASVVGLAASIATASSSSAAPKSGLHAKLAPFGCAVRTAHNPFVCNGISYFAKGAKPAAPGGNPPSTATTPAQLRQAYGLNFTKSNGYQVAIIDAYHHPSANNDMAHFRKAYGIQPCTAATGCFSIRNQDGGTKVTAQSTGTDAAGWGQEVALDLDAVSSICPDCKITLFEANTASNDLFTAYQSAVKKGFKVISNSYGGPESSSDLQADKIFNHPGIASVFSTGDYGYKTPLSDLSGVQYPASSPYVTAVGGTTLTPANNKRKFTEKVWGTAANNPPRGAGSGCSAYEPKPAWQHDGSCKKRTVADTAADADPETGIATYDTQNTCVAGSELTCDEQLESGSAVGGNGFGQAGGTSLAAPIIASIYALAHGPVLKVKNDTPVTDINAASRIYSHRKWLNDVTTGANGSCGGSYLCTGKVYYDGPTGLGTPFGRDAF